MQCVIFRDKHQHLLRSSSLSFFGDHLDVECLEQGLSSSAGTWRFEEEEEEEAQLSIPGLDDRMPFLQMLQSVESPAPFFPLKEPSFQALLRLQHLKKPWELGNSFNMPQMETQIQALELESCVTQHIDFVEELHSPIKSEANKDVNNQHHHPHSTEGVSSECNQEQQPSSVENNSASNGSVSASTWARAQAQTHPQNAPKQIHSSKSLPVTRERRKRKRIRPAKNKEEVESQRMTHIAVERNRRRQMNDHLNVLRSLMPTSYIQRGDQASIVGGAIDFVKELEQLLQTLEAQKKMRKSEGGGGSNNGSDTPVSSSSSSAMAVASNGMFMSLSQYKIGSEESNNNNNNNNGDEVTAENKSEAADIEVTVIQTHVNLKIQCPRRPGQLLKAIVALEDLRLSILHLNINTSHSTVLYSFNLKIEDGCKLGSADEIAGAVHQIFRYMESS
ncbi:transcription factor bHLH70 isoform X1 [Ziziphus jujuba]|uniref:Transcription factor bHLH70 isoform X1 n=2 Tax=Ziziphus jujuba TaxID=326968 RepID=A0A6P6GDS9_ZIZJJ|nr:transcription factor bHLH70 isoform X1 [Ziziphus jujuba]